jgi:SAM-dependent methyltransferase
MLALEDYPYAPDLFHAYRHWLAQPGVERAAGGWRYLGRFYPDYLFVGGASFAIFREAQKYCTGQGLDVGAGLWPLPGTTPVDIERGPARHRSVEDFPAGSVDFVFSSHCLEHIVAWRETLDLWISRLRRGGILFLYLPHPECAIWHPGSAFVGDGHKWMPTPEIIRTALVERGGILVTEDEGPDAMQSFHACARFG